MPLALFDILTAQFCDGQPIDTISESQQTYYSVRSHLIRLLNARRGSLSYLPDYGLPDLNEIYQSLPYSLQELTQAIRHSIEKYEPRLKQVSVLETSLNKHNCVLHLIIRGKIISADTQFDALFRGDGKAILEEE